mmetsp:Transcript_106432/g.243662  ORF Transcript_106432/g.243662 Transcript_106432/m.243662 type:complete len:245 (-) Transcript_106432:55-789(-)
MKQWMAVETLLSAKVGLHSTVDRTQPYPGVPSQLQCQPELEKFRHKLLAMGAPMHKNLKYPHGIRLTAAGIAVKSAVIHVDHRGLHLRWGRRVQGIEGAELGVRVAYSRFRVESRGVPTEVGPPLLGLGVGAEGVPSLGGGRRQVPAAVCGRGLWQGGLTPRAGGYRALFQGLQADRVKETGRCHKNRPLPRGDQRQPAQPGASRLPHDHRVRQRRYEGRFRAWGTLVEDPPLPVPHAGRCARH